MTVTQANAFFARALVFFGHHPIGDMEGEIEAAVTAKTLAAKVTVLERILPGLKRIGTPHALRLAGEIAAALS